MLAHTQELGAYTVAKLREMQQRLAGSGFDCIGDVRGIGLMMGVEIQHERANDLAEEIMYRALSKGLSFKLTMGNILLLVPALTITKTEMDEALGILETSIIECGR